MNALQAGASYFSPIASRIDSAYHSVRSRFAQASAYVYTGATSVYEAGKVVQSALGCVAYQGQTIITQGATYSFEALKEDPLDVCGTTFFGGVAGFFVGIMGGVWVANIFYGTMANLIFEKLAMKYQLRCLHLHVLEVKSLSVH